MKKFFKLFLTFKYPFGEVWLTLIGVLILFTLGFFDFGTLRELVVVALLFVFVSMSIFFISYRWRRWKQKNKTK